MSKRRPRRPIPILHRTSILNLRIVSHTTHISRHNIITPPRNITSLKGTITNRLLNRHRHRLPQPSRQTITLLQIRFLRTSLMMIHSLNLSIQRTSNTFLRNRRITRHFLHRLQHQLTTTRHNPHSRHIRHTLRITSIQARTANSRIHSIVARYRALHIHLNLRSHHTDLRIQQLSHSKRTPTRPKLRTLFRILSFLQMTITNRSSLLLTLSRIIRHIRRLLLHPLLTNRRLSIISRRHVSITMTLTRLISHAITKRPIQRHPKRHTRRLLKPLMRRTNPKVILPSRVTNNVRRINLTRPNATVRRRKIMQTPKIRHSLSHHNTTRLIQPPSSRILRSMTHLRLQLNSIKATANLYHNNTKLNTQHTNSHPSLRTRISRNQVRITNRFGSTQRRTLHSPFRSRKVQNRRHRRTITRLHLRQRRPNPSINQFRHHLGAPRTLLPRVNRHTTKYQFIQKPNDMSNHIQTHP